MSDKSLLDSAARIARMDSTWDRDDVSGWVVRGVEPVGSTPNTWLEEPDTGLIWLHKDTVIPENGVEQGEDWSEVVSTQVAILLGIPCATARLCTRDGRRGSLSLSIVPAGQSLWEGRVVLQGAPGYFPHTEGKPGVDPDRPNVKRPGHSLANIVRALREVAAPAGFEGPDALNGYDVFAGYLILDALIANRDRHEQNWAILTPDLLPSVKRLSPSYDHATSLGYNLTDVARELCVADHDHLATWANRGTAYRFEHTGRPPTLVAHAAWSVALCTREGANWWREQLAECNLDPVQGALRDRAIAEVSDPAARFAHELLDLNLRRLRDALDTSS